MAIYSLNHRTVGRSTHAPRTASFNGRYITREAACTKILGARMPMEREALFAWLDAQEDGDRKNARVIDKVMVALPLELSHDQRAFLVHCFAEDMTEGRASWVAGIHDGQGDADNPHAHIIFRDRDIKTGKRVMQLSEKGSTERLRLSWERHTNQHLKDAGHDARVDRRTLAAQGIDRVAQIHMGQAVRALDAEGKKPHGATTTRIEENEERKRRNTERVRDKAGHDLEWRGNGGMVAEQRAAINWIRTARQKRRMKETAGHQDKPQTPSDRHSPSTHQHHIEPNQPSPSHGRSR